MAAGAVAGMGKAQRIPLRSQPLVQLLVGVTQWSLGWSSTQGQQLLLEGVLEKS